MVRETDGLIYLNGAAATAGNGSVTVDDATAGNVTIVVKAAATATITPRYRVTTDTPTGKYLYDLQILDSAGQASTKTAGDFKVTGDITLAVS